MYASVYVYKIHTSKVDQVMAILTEVTEIYNDLGAMGCRVYQSEDLSPKFGCSSFPQEISIAPDEVLLVELNVFRDKLHHDGLMVQVNEDERVGALAERLAATIDVSKVVRGEFSVVI